MAVNRPFFHDVGWLLRTAGRGAALALRDAAAVGVLHPAILAWRAESALHRPTRQESRALRFAAVLAARRLVQPPSSFTPGATPWWVLRSLVPELALRPGDCFVDVGAGEGHGAALLARWTGARGFAVEPQERLRERGRAAFHALGVPVTAVALLGEVPLGDCRAALVGWTCWDEATRRSTAHALAALPAGARVVTVTWPLLGTAFRPCLQWRRVFPWGKDDIFVLERT